MTNISSRLYKVSIPFNLTFMHANASRSSCDSHILQIEGDNRSGFGEIILRPYVNDREGRLDSDDKIAGRLTEMLNGLTAKGLPDLATLRSFLLDPSWNKPDLPLLAAVEAAFLDLLCRTKNCDIYELLGESPRRERIAYGGILPILSSSAMEKILRTYVKLGIPYLRIKLSRDQGYNERVLNLAREIMGWDFDIRVDVNCGWDLETAEKHGELLQRWKITLVEEPLGPRHGEMIILNERLRGSGVVFVADESAVLFEDVDRIIGDKTFGMLNLRIAKNGGLLRVLELSRRADEKGLTYQLGSHVGETGILSVLGRIAVSLMEAPLYADGSFDDYILSENITRQSYTFGEKGIAPIIRGQYMGYDVAVEKLGRAVPLL